MKRAVGAMLGAAIPLTIIGATWMPDGVMDVVEWWMLNRILPVMFVVMFAGFGWDLVAERERGRAFEKGEG